MNQFQLSFEHFTLSSQAVTFIVCWLHFQTGWQIDTLIVFLASKFWKKSADENKTMKTHNLFLFEKYEK